MLRNFPVKLIHTFIRFGKYFWSIDGQKKIWRETTSQEGFGVTLVGKFGQNTLELIILRGAFDWKYLFTFVANAFKKLGALINFPSRRALNIWNTNIWIENYYSIEVVWFMTTSQHPKYPLYKHHLTLLMRSQFIY